MVVPWPHQFAESETVQLSDLSPVCRRQLHTTGLRSIPHQRRQILRLLPGKGRRRRQILHHTIGHLLREVSEMLSKTIQLSRSIRPIHQLLALGLGERQPVTELELDATQIKLATHAERNAAPTANEILLKGKTMVG